MKSGNEAMIEQEVKQLIRLAEEVGSKAGLYKLMVSFEPLVESRLRSLAANLFGDPTTDPAILQERIELIQKLQQKESETIENYQSKYRAAAQSRVISGIAQSIKWPQVLTATLAVALLRLLLHVFVIELTLFTWAILGIGATLLVLYAAVLPGWIRLTMNYLHDYLNYRGALKRYCKLKRQLDELSERLLTERQMRHEAEEWVSINKTVILSQFELNKAIAERAAELSAIEEAKCLPKDMVLTSH